MRKSVRAALTTVVLAAIGIRLSPLLYYVHWGSDIGEYVAILRGLLDTAHVSTDYGGWGFTYPYFPGMWFLPGAMASLAPVAPSAALGLLVPVAGALAVLPIFLLTARITGEAKAGLFAAALVAVVMPHVYPTSHAAPATVGDLFVFAGLLLFLRLRGDPKALLPFVLVGGALVVTHHLSTYFLLVMVVATLFLRALVRATPAAGETREVAAAGVLVALTLLYWFAYAAPFRDALLSDVDVDPWWLLPAALPVLLAGLAALVVLRRRSERRYRPRYPGLDRAAGLYAGTVGFLFALIAFAAAVAIPGTTIAPPASVLYYFAPVYLLVAFSAPGRRFFDFLRDGLAPFAWILALLASILVGIVAAPRLLIPYRHIEFLIVPLAVLAGIGLFRILDLAGVGQGRRTTVIAIAIVLLAGNALTAFPPPEILGRWQEGTRAPALDAAHWSRDHVDGLLVTDHRASTLAFGFGGVDATWDTTRTPLLAGTFVEARSGLIGIPSPSGVRNGSYVWVDGDIERGVQLYPWDPAVPMSPEAIAKFDDAPFVKVFDNAYARVYWIDWALAP